MYKRKIDKRDHLSKFFRLQEVQRKYTVLLVHDIQLSIYKAFRYSSRELQMNKTVASCM